MIRSALTRLFRLPRLPVLLAIRLYQRTLSPDHGPLRAFHPHGYCRYYPSCSEYGYQAVERHGIVRGFMWTIWRILKCNPWSKGGIDQVK